MRLIDADKLELKHFVQRVTEQPIAYEGTQPVYANYDIIAYDVDNAPTVKAIPIEWIQKQVKDGWYDIIEIMYHWEIENNIKKSILWSEENESRDTESIK